ARSNRDVKRQAGRRHGTGRLAAVEGVFRSHAQLGEAAVRGEPRDIAVRIEPNPADLVEYHRQPFGQSEPTLEAEVVYLAAAPDGVAAGGALVEKDRGQLGQRTGILEQGRVGHG